MYRLVLFALLALGLSSCLLITPDDTTPSTSTVVIEPPAPSTYTYTCGGGRLVVKYLDSNTVQVFYNDAFQTLGLSRTSPDRVYSNGTYTWQLNRGGRGSLFVGGQQVRSGCVF
ncbi:MAG: hypothetical protein C4331_13265 [Meiothermus sp.]